VSPYLKGRRPFIVGRQVDNYKLFIFIYIYEGIYMTNGFRLEKVGLLRSVGGFHGVWACSGVFQAPYYCSPGPPRQWGERCPGLFLKRLLSEVFTWR
jgi:hypothetical protein